MKKVKANEEDRQFIVGLLRETREDFRRTFNELAKSGTKKDKRKFASYWCNLAELAYKQPEPEEKKGGTL
jgi:hypothetical protein